MVRATSEVTAISRKATDELGGCLSALRQVVRLRSRSGLPLSSSVAALDVRYTAAAYESKAMVIGVRRSAALYA